MAISDETQALIDTSQSILIKTLSQEEINGLAYFIDVASGRGDNVTTDEKLSLEKFFTNAINNQDLNKKISETMKQLSPEMGIVSRALGHVRNFCYKTRFIDNIAGINKKTIRNLELLENNQTIQTSEKIHLSEIGMLTDTLKSRDIVNALDQNGIITPGGALDKLKSEITSSESVLQRLNKTVDSGMDVQSGDIYFTHTSKQNALMNRDPKSFFEKAKNHVTKYQHASTLYKKDNATLLESYNTYVEQVGSYIKLANNLRDLHIQEFIKLHEAGQITEEMANIIIKFNAVNMESIDALNEQITNYNTIAQGEAVTPKDFENILQEMQPLVDEALRHNHRDRAMSFFYAIISNAPHLPIEAQNNVFDHTAEQTRNLMQGQESLLMSLYNLNNITVSLDKPKVSHINAEYERYDLSTQEALMSNQYRIDTAKLIKSAEIRETLQEKLGDNWEEQIRNQFSKIAGRVHGNTNFNITNDQDRMIAAGLADYGLASDASEANPQVGLKGKVARSAVGAINTGMGAIKFGNKGHTTTEVEANKYKELRDRMLGVNGKEASKNMLCSEFAAKASLTAIIELSDWIEKETGVKKALNTPIDKHEVLDRVDPQRLLELLKSSGCVTEIQNPILEQLVDTSNHKKNYYAKENATELLYNRITALASTTRDDEAKFVEDATVIFKAYMQAENPEHGRSDQEINDMLKPTLTDLHSTYNNRHPEGFIQKLQQLVVKVKEFCGKTLGYKYNSVRSSVTNILQTPALEKDSAEVIPPNLIKNKVQDALKGIAVQAHVAQDDVQKDNKNAPNGTAVKKYVDSKKSSTLSRER